MCRKILERNDFAWLGLIGSKSKGARFRSRLARDGVAAETIARLVSPIGVEGVNSKWPAAIAVAVAAQLLQGLECPEQGRSVNALPAVDSRGPAAAADAPRGAALWGSPSEALAGECTSPDCAGCAAVRGAADP